MKLNGNFSSLGLAKKYNVRMGILLQQSSAGINGHRPVAEEMFSVAAPFTKKLLIVGRKMNLKQKAKRGDLAKCYYYFSLG